MPDNAETKLSRQHTLSTLSEDLGYFNEQGSPSRRLKQKLEHAVAFKKSAPSYVNMIIENASELRVEAKEEVYCVGDECAFGISPFYVVLRGKLIVENELEVCMGYLNEGEMVGEGGALGLVDNQPLTVRAIDTSPAVLLEIRGSQLETALIAFPAERDHMEALFYEREAQNEEFEKGRASWIASVVVPALTGTALFAGCPEELLQSIAASLTESSYRRGQRIASCGDIAESMLLLLEGEAEVEAKSGAKIGHFTEGATFGEVSCLGLFSCRTMTIRALTKCRVLDVTAKALERAISEFEDDVVRMAFEKLVENRNDQVERGVPLTALPIFAKADDVCVRAVALQAERIDLAPGDFWQPLPSNDPCGPHFGVVVKGQALLETTEESRLVVGLGPGSLFPEGLAAEYNTRARAVTPLEAYRIRTNDFLVAVHSVPSAQDWFYRFRLLERQTNAHISSRLSATKGVTEVLIPHPCDNDIFEWKSRRQRAIEHAQRVKVEKSDALKKLPLMAHGSPSIFLESREAQSCRIFRDEFRPVSTSSVGSVMSRVASAPSFHDDDRAPVFLLSQGDRFPLQGRGVHGTPALRLPRLGTAS